MKNLHLVFISASFLVFMMAACDASVSSKKTDQTTVREFNLQRYFGLWYEIGRYQNSFERNLVGVTATYMPKEDGRVEEKEEEERYGSTRSIQI